MPSWLRSTCIALLCLSPLAWLLWALMLDQLGPDPAKVLMQGTGEWALRGLAVVLLATPMAKCGWPGLFRYRRMLGLCVFLYVSLHLLLFAQVYVGWSATLLLEELQDRPYVLVGFTAWLSAIAVGADLNTSRPQSVRAQLAPATSFNLPRCGAGMAAFTLVSAL